VSLQSRVGLLQGSYAIKNRVLAMNEHEYSRMRARSGNRRDQDLEKDSCSFAAKIYYYATCPAWYSGLSSNVPGATLRIRLLRLRLTASVINWCWPRNSKPPSAIRRYISLTCSDELASRRMTVAACGMRKSLKRTLLDCSFLWSLATSASISTSDGRYGSIS